MTFELTDNLINSIISALENQEVKFVVDSKSNQLVEKTSDIKIDNEEFYELPTWSSADGFSLMEEFVKELHSPIARTELQNILRSGKGVFRGFKDVLKSYPEVEKKWYYLKNKNLVNYINQWYNSLRETWGLEILDFEVEETEDLLNDDFVFSQFNFDLDRNETVDCVISIIKENCASLPKEESFVLTEIFENKIQQEINKNNVGYICRTIQKEFIGCVIFAPFEKSSSKVALLTSVGVRKDFRGLGIGQKLFEQSIDLMKSLNFEWVFIANNILSDLYSPLLFSLGFRKIESGYIMNLFAN